MYELDKITIIDNFLDEEILKKLRIFYFKWRF